MSVVTILDKFQNLVSAVSRAERNLKVDISKHLKKKKKQTIQFERK